MSDSTRACDGLSPERRRLLALLREQRRGPKPGGIRPRGVDAALVPSFGQERLAFLERLAPGSASYNVPLVVQLTGDLDVESLRLALEAVVARHEALRTAFVDRHGNLAATVIPPPRVPLPVDSLATTQDRPDRLAALLAREARRPFDLSEAPLLRARLVRSGPSDHVLSLVMHHIVSDGWSCSILLKEIAALYSARLAGKDATLQPLSCQYPDFALWQRAEPVAARFAAQLAYWRTQLAGIPPLQLSTDKPRPPVQSTRGNRIITTIPAELTNALRGLASGQGVTPFMVLLAAFQTLLYRYTGQTDFGVGTPVACRLPPDTEPLIGLFVNSVVMRADLDGDLTFADLLRRVRMAAIDAFANQEAPFEAVVEDLRPTRDLSRPPVFQTLFDYQRSPLRELSLPGVTMHLLPAETATAKFDLELDVLDSEEGMEVVFEYCSDLFARDTVTALASHYVTVLRAMARDPGQPVALVPLLSAAERQQVLFDWNDTAAAVGGEPCVVRRFELMARARPDHPATVFENRTLSYAELDHRAGALAAHLRCLGVKPGQRVGYLGERCAELMIAVIGILKAGAAYVPLDPTYPPERLRQMVDDATPPLLLTQRKWAANAQTLGVPWLAVDDPDAHAPDDAAAMPVPLADDDIAYVIFTSGTTGRPKGVMVHHGGLRNRLHWMQAEYGLTPDDRVLQKTPLSFDVSVWELFWPLMTGATMVIARPEGHKDPAYLAALMVEQRVTTLHFVPSMLQVFVEHEGARPFPALRRIFASGEALPFELKERCRAAFAAELHNLYGPTEASIDVTYWDCATPTGDDRVVPIGWPIANTQIYILDRHRQPVPAGVAGELYIGGVNVAKGYLNRPELTAERFLPDPFRQDGRLYRTGDLARHRRDGSIEYLGRLDHQVKIRGFRIELGEIENTLAESPLVREAIVIVLTDAAGEKQLAAYVVAATAETPTAAALRRHLADRLPAYMIPHVFIVLAAMPLSSNGKIDRARLPAPDATAAPVSNEPPRGSTEEVLAAVFQEVLGRSEIGRHSSFFAVGGDSIRSLRVVAKLKDRGFAVSVAQVIGNPTVAGLAAEIEHSSPAGTGALAPAFALVAATERQRLGADVEDAFPLASLQAGMVFHYTLHPETALYQNVDSIRLAGPFDMERMTAAVQRVVDRHPVMRSAFDLAGHEPLQLIRRSVKAEVQAFDLRGESVERQEALLGAWIAAEKTRPFALERPPLMRFQIHRWTDDEFQLTLPHHHAILDGWSLTSLCVELFRTYAALLSTPRLPEAPMPPALFRDFVVREQLAAADLAMRHRWLARIDGVPATTLPPGSPPAAPEAERYAELSLLLPTGLAETLGQIAAGAQLPIKSLLLAAHLKALSHLCGEGSVVTGLISSARPEVHGGDEALGLFLNSVPFRLDLAPGCWLDLARAAHAAEADLAPDRIYPMAELQRHAGGQPLFNTLFNYTHFHVLDNMGDSTLRVLRTHSYTRTNLPFVVNFNRDTDAKAGLWLFLAFDTTRYSVARIEAIRETYLRILALIAGDPEGRHDDASLLPAAERQQVLFDWNDTAAAVGGEPCVVRRFELMARARPDHPATVFENRTLSYAELDHRAGALAAHLRCLGVKPGQRVGYLGERCAELMIAVIGILKAGAAYVPLDPTYPPERLRQMVDDATPPLLLTQRKWAANAQTLGVPWLAVDDPDAHAPDDAAAMPVPLADDDIAYVIFTSGTTGRPKGVMVHHGGLRNRLHWMQAEYGLTPDDRVLQKTPLSFDVSVWELFWPLMTGATMVIARPEGHKDPAYLAALMVEQRVTTLHFVPSMLQVFVEHEGARPFPALRRIFASGEALPFELKERCRAAFAAELHNLYGPTEASIDVTYWDCATPTGDDRVVPIGWPIANTQIYILDRHRQPVPAGVAGELYIGGVNVAKGYLNRPELTAERFLPDPFRQDGRLYRTGDLARHRRDGSIEYLGRLDHQVKIRGFRIELGEIENTLAAHPLVEATLVLKRPLPQGDEGLAAYVVPHPVRARALRRRLRLRSGSGGLGTVVELPNGLTAVVADQREAAAGFHAFFVERRLQHLGLRLPEHAVVFEVGSRDDLFGLALADHWAAPTLHATTPNGATRDCQHRTGALHDLRIEDGRPAGSVDLMRVGLQADPLAVLAALSPAMWAETAQVIVEAPAESAAIERVASTLRREGYRVDEATFPDGLTWVFGRRDGLVDGRPPGEALLERANEVAFKAEINAHLRQTLPEHMCPRAYVLLDGFPVTASGKVDRRALLAMGVERQDERTKPSKAPATDEEIQVANLWEQVLGVKGLAADDDFFARGGHSLLAIRVVARARAEFGVPVSLQSLFDHPTVATFAAYLVAVIWARDGAGAAPVATGKQEAGEI